MKYIITLIITFLFYSSCLAKDYVSITTGNFVGTYYAVGVFLAKAVETGNNYNYKITVEAGNGSVFNIRLLEQDKTEFGIVQNDTTFYAYNGQNVFDKPITNLRAVASLFPEHIHIISFKKDIKTFNDLKGKRIAIGMPGSGNEVIAKLLFKEFGFTEKDTKHARYYNMAHITNSVVEEQLDALIGVTGIPSPTLFQISQFKEMYFIPLENSNKLIKKYPFFTNDIIPKDTYKNIKDIKTLSLMAILTTSNSVPEDTVYNLLKNLYNNIDKVVAIHPKAKDVSLNNALLGITIPLHKGAEKYFKEKGIK